MQRRVEGQEPSRTNHHMPAHVCQRASHGSTPGRRAQHAIFWYRNRHVRSRPCPKEGVQLFHVKRNRDQRCFPGPQKVSSIACPSALGSLFLLAHRCTRCRNLSTRQRCKDKFLGPTMAGVRYIQWHPRSKRGSPTLPVPFLVKGDLRRLLPLRGSLPGCTEYAGFHVKPQPRAGQPAIGPIWIPTARGGVPGFDSITGAARPFRPDDVRTGTLQGWQHAHLASRLIATLLRNPIPARFTNRRPSETL